MTDIPSPAISPERADKIRASLLLGACGIRKLAEIFNRYGAQGLSDIVEFKNAYESGVDYPAGRVTDDTTMTMSATGAIIKTLKVYSPYRENFIDKLRPQLWQAFLNWAVLQSGDGAATARIAANIDPHEKWDDLIRAFWFRCGAGDGTLAALMQPRAASIAAPNNYVETPRDKEIKSPNNGCGGMMRAAPFAFLNLGGETIFELAAEQCAITNGHPEAYVAAGATAVLTRAALLGLNAHEALYQTRKLLKLYRGRSGYRDGVETAIRMIDAATAAHAGRPASMQTIDALPQSLGYKNPFMAPPVLAQVAYALLAAETAGVKQAMVIAVNHSGDSDSVGAIVGNILGARHGMAAVPAEWADVLLQKNEILEMADAYIKAIPPVPPRPKPPRKPDRPPFV